MKNYNLETDPKITSGFKTPDNYFDSFSVNIMQQLPTKEVRVISLYERNKKLIYSCVGILTIMISVSLVYKINSHETKLSNIEIENYLTQQNTILEDEIINYLEKEDLVNFEINSSVTDEVLEEELINNDDLEQYITN